ncbi:hypothetical protein [Roseinatronobacter bogoriensis]|uniref:hypothetical protein n=1 Tax=Roseinatronobacter bogoriensis TaxID=119542 RepID=UPI0010DEFA46|nr:hypothetical protein [Rhodobaca bogoriensis]MBB4209161.1 hypothetical protein [Rhodobaca bogoriensis DSM 18756]TDW36311.1 hypothetical protein LY39_02859 [Rhodobaca barguzinensis]TDY67561.1 hypothetical protein EV660_10774 [Rhodobaca bogoriensis DSM 18756]
MKFTQTCGMWARGRVRSSLDGSQEPFRGDLREGHVTPSVLIRISRFVNAQETYRSFDPGVSIGRACQSRRPLVKCDEGRTTARGLDVLAIAKLAKKVFLPSRPSLAADAPVSDDTERE